MVRGIKQGRIRFFLLGVLVIAVILIGVYHGLSYDSRGSSLPFYQPNSVNHDAERSVHSDQHHEGSLVNEIKTNNVFSKFGWGSSKETNTHQCSPLPESKDVQIDTGKLYPQLDFTPTFKTYWNQTFETRYLERKSQWKSLPLKVIILPHSHNDPGWLKTFENYFYSSTVHILNSMVEKLSKNPELRFIWSEMSFFAKWWESLKNRPHLREETKKLLRQGSLEIATGGWVMTDEAGSHYYAMLDQLIEGHQWLRTVLGMSEAPPSGWSVDPFGHSSSWAYILKEAGIKNTVIQRTHFGWKQFLAENSDFEFWWRQAFEQKEPIDGSENKKNLYCLMAPFDLYSIKHTCGPDTDVCRQFDFRHIAGEYSESRSVPITKENVAERAHLILGQYGRTASLFPHNVALIPLGDDFRYNYDIEWEQQKKNYNSLMAYVNLNREEFNNTQIQFGTLKDYFDEVHARRQKLATNISSLKGDFFPYADIYADSKPSYWTGYFTTRPFYKSLSRELEHWLRSAEILFSFALSFSRQKGDLKSVIRLEKDYSYLTTARQSLGLFQHHDAITGTAKELVMEDYGKKLHRGIMESVGVISHSVQFLMLEEPTSRPSDLEIAHPLTAYLFPDVQRPTWYDLTRKAALTNPPIGSRKIIVFNSKVHISREPVRILIDAAFVRVTEMESKEEMVIQVNPVWNESLSIEPKTYEILFVPTLPQLSLTTFLVENLPNGDRLENNAVISVYLNDAMNGGQSKDNRNVFVFENPSDEDFQLKGSRISAIVDRHTGLLKSVITSDGDNHNVDLTMEAYASTEFSSGAYLFSYSNLQNVSERFPIIKRVEGKLGSELTVEYSKSLHIVYRVYTEADTAMGAGLEIEMHCDIRNNPELINWELVMRLYTDIKNAEENHRHFYTDSNGFQILKRQYVASLGNEANYYPMTSSMYIEDERARLTILASHSHGVTSPKDGALEIMLERKIRYDDNRGLGEGILDNKAFKAKFWLLIEPVASSSKEDVPNLSLLAHALSSQLLHPPVILANDGIDERPMRSQLRFLNDSFPCEVQLVNLRVMPSADDYSSPSRSSLMSLHNRGSSCKPSNLINVKGCRDYMAENQRVGVSAKFGFNNVKVESIHRSTLTGMKNVGDKSLSNSLIKSMELASFNVTFA